MFVLLRLHLLLRDTITKTSRNVMVHDKFPSEYRLCINVFIHQTQKKSFRSRSPVFG